VTTAAAPRAVPWAPAQLRTVMLAQILATALVAVAAYKSAHTGTFAEQSDWVVLGIAGVGGAGIVSTAWLLTTKRRVLRRRRRLVAAVQGTFEPVGSARVEAEGFGPVAGASMSHYHRAGCQLVRGKAVEPSSVIEHHRAKRTPCAVCRP
jgi:hypothetical protein